MISQSFRDKKLVNFNQKRSRKLTLSHHPGEKVVKAGHLKQNRSKKNGIKL